jgi:hypothetical protein
MVHLSASLPPASLEYPYTPTHPEKPGAGSRTEGTLKPIGDRLRVIKAGGGRAYLRSNFTQID